MKNFIFNSTILFLSICFITISASANTGPMQNPKGGNTDEGDGGGDQCHILQIPCSLALYVQGEYSEEDFSLSEEGMPAMHLAIYRHFPKNPLSNPLDISSLQQVFLSGPVDVFQPTNEFCNFDATSAGDRIFSAEVLIPCASIKRDLAPRCDTDDPTDVHLVYAFVTFQLNQTHLYPVDLFSEHFECLLPVVNSEPWITNASLIVHQYNVCCRHEFQPRLSRDGASSENLEYEVAILPNPVRNQFQIETNFTEIVSMRVVNLNGESVFESNRIDSIIDTSSWDPGMYIVHIKRLDATITKKVLKL